MRWSLKLAVAVLSVVGAAGCASTASSHPKSAAASLETWNENHPEAARELCAWANAHPQAATRLFDWEGTHEARAHEFVDWAVVHPHQGLDTFVSEHPRWDEFDFVTETHRPAANAFIAWARRHPEAAQALMNHPGGLKWAARHQSC